MLDDRTTYSLIKQLTRGNQRCRSPNGGTSACTKPCCHLSLIQCPRRLSYSVVRPRRWAPQAKWGLRKSRTHSPAARSSQHTHLRCSSIDGKATRLKCILLQHGLLRKQELRRSKRSGRQKATRVPRQLPQGGPQPILCRLPQLRLAGKTGEW